MGKKLFLVISALFDTANCCFASGLTFQIIQHNDSLNEVCESAMVIEDEMLNYFFNSGYIVTNAPASVSSSIEMDDKLWKVAVNEAAGGSADVFVQVHLYFNENAGESSKVSLGLIDKISWKAQAIKSGRILEESSMKVKKPIGIDTEQNVRLFAGQFASHLKEVLKKK